MLRACREGGRHQWEGIFLSTLSLRRATWMGEISRRLGDLFLSTLSLRRATRRHDLHPRQGAISIHALLAESDWWLRCWQLAARDISIHALLAESDGRSWRKQLNHHKFLSTLSLRRATVKFSVSGSVLVISIHALLAESDSLTERRHWQVGQFLSTLSLRRATVASLLAVGGSRYFYPRSPCGERQSFWPPY